MLVAEFIETYCQDIVDECNRSSDPLAASEFSFDEMVEQDDGRKEKVIFSSRGNILVRDIVELTEEDFRRKYASVEECELRHRYLESFVILWGEEVITRARQEIDKARMKFDTFKDYDPSDVWKC
jgi:hypothetical protein